jgi:hypothetical protein
VNKDKIAAANPTLAGDRFGTEPLGNVQVLEDPAFEKLKRSLPPFAGRTTAITHYTTHLRLQTQMHSLFETSSRSAISEATTDRPRTIHGSAYCSFNLFEICNLGIEE